MQICCLKEVVVQLDISDQSYIDDFLCGIDFRHSILSSVFFGYFTWSNFLRVTTEILRKKQFRFWMSFMNHWRDIGELSLFPLKFQASSGESSKKLSLRLRREKLFEWRRRLKKDFNFISVSVLICYCLRKNCESFRICDFNQILLADFTAALNFIAATDEQGNDCTWIRWSCRPEFHCQSVTFHNVSIKTENLHF